VAWSGADTYNAMQLTDDVSNLRRQTHEFQSQYQRVTAQFPQTPASTDDLRHTVEMAQQIRDAQRTPEPMFLIVSRALDSSPQIQLSHLAWHYGHKALSGESNPSQAAANGRTSAESNALVQSGIVRGEVRPFDGDYKAAMAFIQAFATRLAEDSTVAEVRALKLPLNSSSDAGLTGSTNATSAKGNAEFEFSIVLKAGV
jgi:hypothetical protein